MNPIKISLLFISVLLSIWIIPCYADDTSILTQIRDIDFSIFKKLDTLLTDIALTSRDWMKVKDPNNIIANNQNLFATLNSMNNTISDQLNFSNALLTDYVTKGSTQNPKAVPPNMGEFLYSNLFQTQPSNAIGAYLTNASGAKIYIKQADPGWKETDAKREYKGLYDTIAAVISYNAFVLGQLRNTPAQMNTRNNLMNMASNSEWFKSVATESLGLVLRQLLMYTSQNYVQLDRMLKIQEQQLALQAMNNTLLIGYIGSDTMDGLYLKAFYGKQQ